jgi:hypothetical protein
VPPELTLTVEEAYRGGHGTVALSTPDGTREHDVTIPPGVTDGQRIRLAGQGSSRLDDGVEVTETARRHLATAGFDPVYGARGGLVVQTRPQPTLASHATEADGNRPDS